MEAVPSEQHVQEHLKVLVRDESKIGIDRKQIPEMVVQCRNLRIRRTARGGGGEWRVVELSLEGDGNSGRDFGKNRGAVRP